MTFETPKDKFKVIEGGFGPASKANTKTRKSRNQQLREIANALRMSNETAGYGPLWGGPAFVRCILAAIGTFVVLSTVRDFAQDYFPIVKSISWFPLLLCAILVYGIVLYKSPFRTWTAKIYDLLANYDPKDIDAYQQLQQDVAEYGLYRERVADWISVERAALSQPTKNGPGDPRSRFLNKSF